MWVSTASYQRVSRRTTVQTSLATKTARMRQSSAATQRVTRGIVEKVVSRMVVSRSVPANLSRFPVTALCLKIELKSGLAAGAHVAQPEARAQPLANQTAPAPAK
jgi:hypothetical protein